ncbi:hypothetical protein ACSBR1_022023 [Camellia fascicularis]
MDEEISSGSSSEGINEINIENEMEEIENVEVETENVEVETEDPKVGMMFKSSDEIYEYYATYGKKNGFAVSKKNCKKGGDREKKYITLACTRAGKAIIKTSNPVADLATSCDNKCDKVVEQLRELKGELKEEVDVVSGSNKFGSMSTQNASSSYGDGVLNSKESTTILDPIVVRQKGRPPCKRKQSMLEKTIKKKQRVKTKTKTKTTSTSSQGNIEQSEFSAPSHMGFVDLGTQKSIKINEYEMLAPSFGQQNMLQGHLSSQGHHHPSQSWMLGNSSFAKMLNDMAQSQSENPE